MISIVRLPFDPAHESVTGRRWEDILWSFSVFETFFKKGIDGLKMKRFVLPSSPWGSGL